MILKYEELNDVLIGRNVHLIGTTQPQTMRKYSPLLRVEVYPTSKLLVWSEYSVCSIYPPNTMSMIWLPYMDDIEYACYLADTSVKEGE